MIFFSYLVGATVGFLASIPIAGPISALVFKCGLNGYYREGRSIALGAALPEALYAYLAFWGFNTLFADYKYMMPLSQAVAAIILFALGVQFIWMANKEARKSAVEVVKGSYLAGFLKGFGITAFNPTLIATWTGMVTTLYSMKLFEFSQSNTVAFSVGVSTGVFVWFTIILLLLRKFRERVEQTVMHKVTKVVGGLLIILAIWFGVTAARTWVGLIQ